MAAGGPPVVRGGAIPCGEQDPCRTVGARTRRVGRTGGPFRSAPVRSGAPPLPRRSARPQEASARVTAVPEEPRRPLRVASVPDRSPYVDAVLPDRVLRVGPDAVPSAWLDPAYLAAHT